MRRTLEIPGQDPITLPSGTVGVSFSGGVDSALLLYMVMLQTDLPVHLFSVVSRWLDCCELGVHAHILSYLNQRFPDKNILHTVRYADSADHMQQLLFQEPRRALYKTQSIKSFLTGLTLMPSTEQQVAAEFPCVLDEQGEFLERNPNIKQPIRRGPGWFCPLSNLNKKDIAELYQQHNIMDLFDLTRSCVVSPQHCNYCWWCAEREWAFGKL